MAILSNKKADVKNPNIVSSYNPKGGVCKSTTIVNIAIELQKRGIDCCLIDCDPQKTATSLNIIRKNKGRKPLDVYGYDELIVRYARENGIRDIKDVNIAKALATFVNKMLDENKKILFDLAGSDNNLNRAIVYMSDLLIIPERPNLVDELAFSRMYKKLITLETNAVAKVLFTMTNPRSKNFSEQKQAIKDKYQLDVFETNLSQYSAFESSFLIGKGVVELEGEMGIKAGDIIRSLVGEIYGEI